MFGLVKEVEEDVDVVVGDVVVVVDDGEENTEDNSVVVKEVVGVVEDVEDVVFVSA